MSLHLYFLGLYNTVTDGLKVLGEASSEAFHATCNYLNGTSSEWYFFDDSSPLPSSIYNMPSRRFRDRVQFTYNTYHNTLIQTYSDFQPNALTVDWLSANLVIDGKEYVLDDFIQNFYLAIYDYQRFTVRHFIDAWSIRSRIWPDECELHIIDSGGESHVFQANDGVNDEWIALMPLPVQNGSDLTVDSEEEEEEYEGGDEEEEEEEEEEDTSPSETVDTSLVPDADDTTASDETTVDTPVESSVPIETTVDTPVETTIDTPAPVETTVETTVDTPVETTIDTPAPVSTTVETPQATLVEASTTEVQPEPVEFEAPPNTPLPPSPIEESTGLIAELTILPLVSEGQ